MFMHNCRRSLLVATTTATVLLLAGASHLHARESGPPTRPLAARSVVPPLSLPLAPAGTFSAPARAASILARQGTEPRRGAPITVTLAFVDSLPRVEALATVVRRGGARPANIVLLRRPTANATVLAGALAALSAQHRRSADAIDGEIRITVTHAEFAPVSRGDEARFGRMFEKLTRAGVREVAGFGRLQAVDLTIGDPATSAP